MRFFITGATGFIGPYLIDRLISENHFCRCLLRPKANTESIAGPGVEIVRGDITEPASLEGMAEGMDAVLHLATLGHMNNFTVTEDMFRAINVQGTVNVMREALRAGVGRIVHCSSVAAMGICDETPATEETPCRPHHPYGFSKLDAEKEVLRMVREEGLPAMILRFSMVYGPGDPRDMLKLTRMAKKGLFPKVGSKPKLTPLIHVRDAVEGIRLAREKGRPGEVYLITNDRSEPFDRLREIILQALNVRRFPLYAPERMALIAASSVEGICKLLGKAPPVTRKNIESTLADRVFSIDKARRELGFKPVIDPVDGITDTVHWYLKEGWI